MTTKHLRQSLLLDMKALRTKQITVSEARVLTKQASTINQSLRFDLENKRENIRLMKALSKKEYNDLTLTALQIA